MILSPTEGAERKRMKMSKIYPSVIASIYMYSINFEGGLRMRCNNNSDNKDNSSSSLYFRISCAQKENGLRCFPWDKLSYYFSRREFYSRLL